MPGGLDSVSSAPLAPRRSGSSPAADAAGALPLMPRPVRAILPPALSEEQAAAIAGAPRQQQSPTRPAAREMSMASAPHPPAPAGPPARPSNESPRSTPPSRDPIDMPRPRVTRRSVEAPVPEPLPAKRSTPSRPAERSDAAAPVGAPVPPHGRTALRTTLPAPPVAARPARAGEVPMQASSPSPKPAAVTAKPTASAKPAAVAARLPLSPRAAAPAPEPQSSIESRRVRQPVEAGERVEIRQVVREIVTRAAQSAARPTRIVAETTAVRTAASKRAAPQTIPQPKILSSSPRAAAREKPHAVPARLVAAPQRHTPVAAAPRISIEIGRIDITTRLAPKPVLRAQSRVSAPRSHSIDPGLRSGGD